MGSIGVVLVEILGGELELSGSPPWRKEIGAVETTKDWCYGGQIAMVWSFILCDSDARRWGGLELYWWRYWGVNCSSLDYHLGEEKLGSVETTKDQCYGDQIAMVWSLILCDSDARRWGPLDLYWWRYWGVSVDSQDHHLGGVKRALHVYHQEVLRCRSNWNGLVAYIVRY
jgi:hypothetical protein